MNVLFGEQTYGLLIPSPQRAILLRVPELVSLGLTVLVCPGR